MTTTDAKDLDRLAINTIRFLAADAVEKANSGHPGMPMGAAAMAYVLWTRHLRFNPRNPEWFDRDRFILSAGHGSMLLYALLHLTGYDLPMEQLKLFRQFESMTPGHPERNHTPGVEVTTGPLGQGFGNGVGMAIAERFLGASFNRPGHDIIDHFTYAIVSDGDLMEGVASEAASLAGHLRLGRMVYLYDDNHISIEGDTDLAFTEDVGKRFEAYGWHVQHVTDGNDIEAIDAAITAAKAETDAPSLICVRTHIGFGSPKQDTREVHGEPLGAEAMKASKERLGWPLEPTFLVPSEVEAHFREAIGRGEALESAWNGKVRGYAEAHADVAADLRRAIDATLPDGWDSDIPTFPTTKKLSTRDASGKVMNAIAPKLPTFLGGSADLAPSTKTNLDKYGSVGTAASDGRNLHFGVREHAMGSAVNGMTAHGGIIAFGATFLIFSDYQRPTLRLAALMRVPSIFVYTHDSIGLGEDGPTHQPIEQLASMRAIPNFVTLRPADANETAAAWRIAIERGGPVALVLTRQGLPVLDAERHDIRAGVEHGAYVLADPDDGAPDVILIGTGSEVSLAMEAAEALAGEGVRSRVVSMPSMELFRAQSEAYRASVLPRDVPKLAIEAASPFGWREWVGDDGGVIGLERFGVSAPGPVAMGKLGFNVDNVVTHARALLTTRVTGGA